MGLPLLYIYIPIIEAMAETTSSLEQISDNPYIIAKNVDQKAALVRLEGLHLYCKKVVIDLNHYLLKKELMRR